METEWPRMTVDSLKDCNKKFLVQMAKDQGIVGWHACEGSIDPCIVGAAANGQEVGRQGRGGKGSGGVRAGSRAAAPATPPP